MEKYLGVKVIHAEPMTADEYSEKVRPLVTSFEDKRGYKVIWTDDSISWLPKTIFEAAYRRIDNLTFGLALEGMNMGHKVYRKTWGNNGTFIYLVKGSVIPFEKLRNEAATHICQINGLNDSIHVNPHIDMRASNGNIVVGWLPSVDDILAEDWYILN